VREPGAGVRIERALFRADGSGNCGIFLGQNFVRCEQKASPPDRPHLPTGITCWGSRPMTIYGLDISAVQGGKRLPPQERSSTVRATRKPTYILRVAKDTWSRKPDRTLSRSSSQDRVLCESCNLLQYHPSDHSRNPAPTP